MFKLLEEFTCASYGSKKKDPEDRSRRNNIRIIGIPYGIPENEKETTTETENKVQRLFQKDLGINEEVVIEPAHRSGPKIFKDGKPNSKRVIVMKLLNYKDKQKILKDTQKNSYTTKAFT